MDRLLILSCSARKRQIPAVPIAALQRYDGVFFRVLRKWMRDRPFQPLYVVIISSKYGAITGRTAIVDYDQKMTAERAVALGASLRSRLRNASRRRRFGSIFINVGRLYAGVIAGVPELDRALRATG